MNVVHVQMMLPRRGAAQHTAGMSGSSASRAPVLLVAYAVASGLNVLGHLVDAAALTVVTKPLLMPLLAGYLLAATGRPLTRRVRLVLVALAFSWVGDVALMGVGDGWFLAGLGGFLLAQLSYIAAFAPSVRAGPLGRRPVLALPYVAAWAALIAVLAPSLGGLLVPVMLYGAALMTMAATATGVHRWTAVGAALFVASDSLLALTRLSDAVSLGEGAAGALVMSTYTLGQGLIVAGVVAAERVRSTAALGSAAPAPR
jgi:uncharacterized membrane protein YhhN